MKQNLLFNQTSAIGKRIAMVLTMLLIVGIGQAWGAEETATLSFADKAQRTSFSTTKQVWEQNGVTFTNDKASSTNNVADYAAPVRLYANSSVTVACSLGNMTKIVFDCSSDSYATAMKNSIGNAATATSDKVTVTLDGTSKTFTVAKLTAQVRLEAITVTYEEGSSTVSVTSVTLNKTELDLIVDATEQLTATVLPNDATNKNVSWSSNNTAVATVNNGLVTAVAAGNATITVTTEDGNKTATCTISVTAPAGGGGGEGECDKWVEVQLADIVQTDEVVICMEKQGELWALPNDGGASTPTAVVIDSDDFSSKDGIGSSLKWNIKNNNGNLEIYPNGTTSKWLYCTNSNSGVRVGTEGDKTFTIVENYLQHTTTTRYVGVYVTNPDWRCYTNTTGNIVNQTLKFYKYVECITETTVCLIH